jgi:glyoxylase-like metal-dependent hydrolase (beta-lactamase superfamily II)
LDAGLRPSYDGLLGGAAATSRWLSAAVTLTHSPVHASQPTESMITSLLREMRMADNGKLTLKAAIVPVTPLQQNCTLVWSETTKKGAVIDPGGDVPVILDAIKQVGMIPEKIVLTHGHLDHVGGAMELKDALGVPIEGPHIADKFLMERAEEQARAYGLSGMQNATSDRWLNEGDKLAFGGETFEIFHCPGHSPGSLVYYN